MAQNISNETKNEAMRVAKATQKPGQNKEQTKLIALGIEKGIAEYKKQQKGKARERDKLRKQDLKAKTRVQPARCEADEGQEASPSGSRLPWGLLVLSWLGFAAYLFLA